MNMKPVLEIVGLSHFCLSTKRLDEMIDFYVQLMGAQIVHEFRNAKRERYGVFIKLGKRTFLEIFNSLKPLRNGGRFRHLSVEVANIESTTNKLKSVGYNPKIERGRTDGLLQCWIDDPDGNRIEFIQYDSECVLTPFLDLE